MLGLRRVFAATPVNLSLSAAEVFEETFQNTGPASITVFATADGPVMGNQTLQVNVSGTGVNPGDYMLSNTIITIPDGQTQGSVTFSAVNDTEFEVRETATLSLSNLSAGLVAGTTLSQNVDIRDIDIPDIEMISIKSLAEKLVTPIGDIIARGGGNVDNPCTSYYGIFCEPLANGPAITIISMAGKGSYNGPVPEGVPIGANSYNGPIPEEVNNFASLSHLTMTNIGFTGTLAPLKLESFPLAIHVNFGSNRLTGSFEELRDDNGNFPTSGVTSFNFSMNELSGPISDDFGNFLTTNGTSAMVPQLQQNRLSGPLPTGLPHIYNGELHFNQFEGPLTELAVGTGGVLVADFARFDVTTDYPGVDPVWKEHQTVPPANVAVAPNGPGSATLSWTPILYQADPGFYEVFSSQSPGGPYVRRGTTKTSGGKAATGLTVSGLPAGTNYFIVRSTTYAHYTRGTSLVNGQPVVTPESGYLGQIYDLESIDSAEVTADITVPPGFATGFGPNTIGTGGVSTLTFTIDNTLNLSAASSLDFTDNMPAAVTVASLANASTTCTGGMLTATSGTSVISYSGGTVAATSSCTVQVDVTSNTTGTHVNTTGDLTSSLGNSGTANDSLVVEPPPTFSQVFAPDSIIAGDTSTLTFTIDNSASSLTATSLAFSDTLPAGVVLASPANASTTCTGGLISAPDGGATITYVDGSVAAGASCTIQVNVTSDSPNTYLNTSGDLTSSSGNSGTASDTLEVIGLDFGDAPTGGAVGAPPDSYPTLLADNGARHIIVNGGPRLGAAIDAEGNGQPNATATGDDNAISDDEDGVAFVTSSFAGQSTQVTVVTLNGGFLNAFVDFNADGDWLDAGEQIFTNQPVTDGVNHLAFPVPVTAVPGITFARFRLNSTGGLSSTGLATDGEVEDYQVVIADLTTTSGDSPSINENANTSSPANVTTLFRGDATNGDIQTFSLVAGAGDTDNHRFQIHGNLLQINVGEVIDFESLASYSIRVLSQVNGSLPVTKVFHITVNDVDEAPVIDPIADISTLVDQVILDITGEEPDFTPNALLTPAERFAASSTLSVNVQVVTTGLQDLIFSLSAEVHGSLYENFYGAAEKWLYAPGESQWYFILPGGEFYRWAGAGSATGLLLGVLDPVAYVDPVGEIVLAASASDIPDPAGGSNLVVNASVNQVTDQVTIDRVSGSGAVRVLVTATDPTNLTDTEEFFVTFTQAPTLAPITDTDNSLGGDSASSPLSAVDGNPADLLTFTFTVQAVEVALESELDFRIDGSDYFNAYGAAEKWVRAANNDWYFITPTGLSGAELYKWDGTGSASGTLVSALSAGTYDDPTLLTEALVAPVAPPVTVGFTVNPLIGSGLSQADVTRSDPGYTGVVRVTVTVTDSTSLSDSESFDVTFINSSAPVLDTIAGGNNSLGGDTVVADLSATDSDPLDVLTFSATVQTVEVALESEHDFRIDGSDYFNFYGSNEKWVRAANNDWYF
ncbi:MAG: hypothetical protein KDA60_09705, partial [Planctomycetales bacterium]|nr:hypothetical protein [Planctomycetales bacterium]